MNYVGILVSINFLATVINHSIIHFIAGENNLFLFIQMYHFPYSLRLGNISIWVLLEGILLLLSKYIIFFSIIVTNLQRRTCFYYLGLLWYRNSLLQNLSIQKNKWLFIETPLTYQWHCSGSAHRIVFTIQSCNSSICSK